jgi:hypothetical protein
VRVWIPWQLWLVIIPLGVVFYIMWACVAVAVFIVVSLVAIAVTRSFRRGVRVGGLTFAAMIAPGHMTRAHNDRHRVVNVRVVA